MLAGPSKCSAWVMLGALLLGGVLPAEEARPQQPGLYDGAVGGKLDEIAEKSVTRVNPETMENAPWPLVKARIEQMTGMQVVVDEQALTDSGIDLPNDRIIPLWLKGETVTYLETLLTRQLGGTPLTWFVQDGVVTLTTEEQANQTYVTRQYPIGDLLSEERGSDVMIALLEQSTRGPWDADEPGTGTLSVVGNLLYVRQTHRMQPAVAEILAGLRRKDPVVLTNCSEEDLRLRRVLDEKLISFDFPDNTLKEVADFLTQLTGAKFRLDQQGLTDAGLDEDTRVNARAVNLPLHVALQQMLGNVNGTELTVQVSDEECLITTKEKADLMYETVLYRVGPLGMTGERLIQFVAMLEQETSGPWDADEPGTGTIVFLKTENIVAVRQTQRVHREILEILRGLRPTPTVSPQHTTRSVAQPVAPVALATAQSEPVIQVHAVHPAPSTTGSLLQSMRKPFASVTWEGFGVYAPLLMALLLGCVAGYLCRH